MMKIGKAIEKNLKFCALDEYFPILFQKNDRLLGFLPKNGKGFEKRKVLKGGHVETDENKSDSHPL